ncbi:Methyladenine glycosylase [Musa troglodytarum]|uniref:Methyladenine glycosylase n=1 Tax=Musa troglodytarum TaxID=320322 RepID=A0A9E7GQE1_9LILI|nr:Methyladenine glycosylase [Musa troglodytarum]URE19632.1 Methyladenine glycosylase [Musa troglodytarum]
MSGAPKVRSMNVDEPEAKPLLGPAGNKARLVVAARKTGLKSSRKAEKVEPELLDDKQSSTSLADSASPSLNAASALRRHELLLRSNLSLNASCCSDASVDSFCSRASTGRIGSSNFLRRPRRTVSKPEKIGVKLEKMVPDGTTMPPPEFLDGKRRCAWVTPNTDPCYAVFHDEEWGVPVHDDKKLFELLSLSGALAEHTWPAILSKRRLFREVFMDFDPILVSKLNDKKIIVPGSTANSLLSEPKLRAIIENAPQVIKIKEEFGSFDRYCWSFVNHKPILSGFRNSRQVPVKSAKADAISKDLMRRGLRSVGPTVIYSFMQASGITNDHLVTCYRFKECAATNLPTDGGEGNLVTANHKVEENIIGSEEAGGVDLELSMVAADRLNIS